MNYACIDRLEPRRLLTGGVTAVGSPITVASIPSQFAPLTASSIGPNDSFIAYVKNGTLDGLILDSSGNTIVPEFAIDTANPYGKMAAIEDSNGNAVIAYTDSSGDTLEIARINSAGQIVDAPSIAMNATDAIYQAPALTVASDGSIAVVAIDAGSNPGSIYGGVFDSSDTPKFTASVISTIASNAPGGALLTNPSVVYASSTGNFLAAWDEEDLNPNYTDTQETINDNTFTPTGTIGTQQVIATAPNTSTSDNVLRQPFLLPTADVSQFLMYYDEDDFSPAPDYTFGGSNVFVATINPDGTLSGTPVNAYQTIAPNEVQLTSAQQFTVNGTSSSSIYTGKIQPLDDSTSTDNVLEGKTGTYNGNFAAIAPVALVFAAVKFVIANQIAFAVATGDYHGISFGIVSSTADTSTNTSTVDVDETEFTPPTVPADDPNVGVGPGVEYSASHILTFTISLDKATDHDVTLNVSTNGSDGFFSGITNQAYTIPAGETDAIVNVDLTSPGPTVDDTVTLQIVSATGATVTQDNSTGTIAAEPETTESATPGDPVSITDSDNTQELVSTTDGSIDIATAADGTRTITVSGTNKKSKVLIIPKGKVGDLNIGDFISTSPVGTIDAPDTNIGGNIELNGVTSATFGNVKDNHLITLGALSNATLKFADVANADLTSTGSIKTLTVHSWAGGSISAGTIGTLTSSGNLDADLAVTSITKMTVGGILGGTSASDVRYLRASSNFGTITAGGFQDADLFAGVDSSITDLPTNEGAFTNAAGLIKSFTIKGTSPIFSDGDIAAATIDTITLAGLVPDNGTAFGVVAEKILKYRQGNTSKKKITMPQSLDSSGEYSATTV